MKNERKKNFGNFSWKIFFSFIYQKNFFFKFLNDKLGIKNYMFQVSPSFTWQVGRCHMVIWKQGVQGQKFLFMKIFEKNFDQQIGETKSNLHATFGACISFLVVFFCFAYFYVHFWHRKFYDHYTKFTCSIVEGGIAFGDPDPNNLEKHSKILVNLL